jgi:RNA polymerase sigma factor (TIGR02999 family)
MSDVTRILNAIEHGDGKAADELLPLVYEELRLLAAQKLSQEKPGQTLQATALVHEAYLRLVDGGCNDWNSRGHFFKAAAEAMRRILVEIARRKQAQKRGGAQQRLHFEDVVMATRTSPEEIVMIDDAITRLAEEDVQAAEIVKLRLFAGLSVEEAADATGISRATAYREWTYARAWLCSDINGSQQS